MSFGRLYSGRSNHYAGMAIDVALPVVPKPPPPGNVVLWGARKGDVQWAKKNLPAVDAIITRKQGAAPNHQHFHIYADGIPRTWFLGAGRWSVR